MSAAVRSIRFTLNGAAAECTVAPYETLVDVLRVVAEGLTDVQVAQKLVLSPRTVSTHLRSIYNKLGINSRAAATRFALENHLA